MEEFYYEVLLPAGVESIEAAQKLPLIMLHGAWHTMGCYKRTPDGRDGWASLFVSKGYPVILVDLLGHGKSNMPSDFLSMSTARHSAALNNLVEKFGNCIVLNHSLSGQVTWKAIDTATPEVKVKYKGLVAVTPTRPGNLAEEERGMLPEDNPHVLPAEVVKMLLANTTTFPHAQFEGYLTDFLVGESPHAFNTFNNASLAKAELSVSSGNILQDIPTLILSAEQDKATPAAIVADIADFFGKHVTMVDKDWSLLDHGHMLMLEQGNEIIAQKIIDWLDMNLSK
jgi:pimeloyl-ACP methyl ester carboxylesterase